MSFVCFGGYSGNKYNNGTEYFYGIRVINRIKQVKIRLSIDKCVSLWNYFSSNTSIVASRVVVRLGHRLLDALGLVVCAWSEEAP